MDTTVEIDIGGTNFRTRRDTLKSIDGSYLSNLDISDKLYFDRDSFLFRHILNAYRDGVVHVPRDVCPNSFKKELIFWKIPFKLVAPCCWKYLYEADDDIETLKILLEGQNKYDSQNKIDFAQNSIRTSVFQKENGKDAGDNAEVKDSLNTKQQNTTSRLWLFLDEPASSTAAKIWLFFYICVVLVSVAVYVIWLDPSVRVSRYITKNPDVDVLTNQTIFKWLLTIYNEKMIYLAESDPHPILLSLDMFSVVFFILETLVHFCVCPEKRRYCLNPYHALKIILCICMTVSTFYEFRKDLLPMNDYAIGQLYYGLKSMNVLRLLLIFRLHKVYNGLHILLFSLKHSIKELTLLMFSFMIAVVVYGCLIFSAEIESEMFPSTQIAMWWSLITMTTIGYGDLHPVSSWGYLVGVICAINGIIVLALPVAAIASTFSSFYSRNADLHKHIAEVRKQENDVLTVIEVDDCSFIDANAKCDTGTIQKCQ